MAAGRGDFAAIVLAAGSSIRFGPENKLLADAGGRPLVARVVAPLLACGLSPVIIVTGHERDQVEAALAGLQVEFVHNARYLDGMGGSVAAGVSAVLAGVAGILITPGDTPNLSKALLERLLSAFAAAAGEKIVFPLTSAGEQRNPVIWPARLLPELATLRGEKGAKAIIGRYPLETIGVPVADDDDLLDIDRVEDLEQWRTGNRHRRRDG
ncbi:MAG: nucleotidyltransferase family protein [Hyphomicrobiaceae bacterium]|nr:MAG: nucleotidyltransferase family protein [Hyphomicrobiaceae bacterium]